MQGITQIYSYPVIFSSLDFPNLTGESKHPSLAIARQFGSLLV